MRLIDADKLEKEMQNKCVGDCGCCVGDCPVFIQPTAIDLEEHDKQIGSDAIDEFIKKCKASHAYDGLITNWDKPYGITFERMEQLKGEEYDKERELRA